VMEREEGWMRGGARRVRVEPKWRVDDIVVPPPSAVDGSKEGGKEGTQGWEKEEKTPMRGRVRLSEEERKVRYALFFSPFYYHIKVNIEFAGHPRT